MYVHSIPKNRDWTVLKSHVDHCNETIANPQVLAAVLPKHQMFYSRLPPPPAKECKTELRTILVPNVMNNVQKGIEKKPAHTATSALWHLADPKITVGSLLTWHCIHAHKWVYKSSTLYTKKCTHPTLLPQSSQEKMQVAKNLLMLLHPKTSFLHNFSPGAMKNQDSNVMVFLSDVSLHCPFQNSQELN